MQNKLLIGTIFKARKSRRLQVDFARGPTVVPNSRNPLIVGVALCGSPLGRRDSPKNSLSPTFVKVTQSLGWCMYCSSVEVRTTQVTTGDVLWQRTVVGVLVLLGKKDVRKSESRPQKCHHHEH